MRVLPPLNRRLLLPFTFALALLALLTAPPKAAATTCETNCWDWFENHCIAYQTCCVNESTKRWGCCTYAPDGSGRQCDYGSYEAQ
jgi:hypothetical protein